MLIAAESVEQAVAQAIGAASMCWTEPPTSEFDSEGASDVVDALLHYLRAARQAVTGAERLARLEVAALMAASARAELQQEAVEAVGQGLPKAAVARAAGLSRVTLDRWLASSCTRGQGAS